MNYSLDEQIAEVNRELALRANVYPKMIEAGRLTKQKAERQTLLLRAALGTLMAAKAQAGPSVR